MTTEQIEKWCEENSIVTGLDLHTALAFAEYCGKHYFRSDILDDWVEKGPGNYSRFTTDELWAIFCGSKYKGMIQEIDLLRDRLHDLELELQIEKSKR